MALIVVFLLGFMLSTDHLGIQSGLIKGRCRANISIQDIGSFKDLLLKNKPCNQVAWEILGVPASGWNALIFLGSTFGCFIYCRKKPHD